MRTHTFTHAHMHARTHAQTVKYCLAEQRVIFGLPQLGENFYKFFRMI